MLMESSYIEFRHNLCNTRYHTMNNCIFKLSLDIVISRIGSVLKYLLLKDHLKTIRLGITNKIHFHLFSHIRKYVKSQRSIQNIWFFSYSFLNKHKGVFFISQACINVNTFLKGNIVSFLSLDYFDISIILKLGKFII